MQSDDEGRDLMPPETEQEAAQPTSEGTGGAMRDIPLFPTKQRTFSDMSAADEATEEDHVESSEQEEGGGEFTPAAQRGPSELPPMFSSPGQSLTLVDYALSASGLPIGSRVSAGVTDVQTEGTATEVANATLSSETQETQEQILLETGASAAASVDEVPAIELVCTRSREGDILGSSAESPPASSPFADDSHSPGAMNTGDSQSVAFNSLRSEQVPRAADVPSPSLDDYATLSIRDGQTTAAAGLTSLSTIPERAGEIVDGTAPAEQNEHEHDSGAQTDVAFAGRETNTPLGPFFDAVATRTRSSTRQSDPGISGSSTATSNAAMTTSRVRASGPRRGSNYAGASATDVYLHLTGSLPPALAGGVWEQLPLAPPSDSDVGTPSGLNSGPTRRSERIRRHSRTPTVPQSRTPVVPQSRTPAERQSRTPGASGELIATARSTRARRTPTIQPTPSSARSGKASSSTRPPASPGGRSVEAVSGRTRSQGPPSGNLRSHSKSQR
jgi:hypothetical protein